MTEIDATEATRSASDTENRVRDVIIIGGAGLSGIDCAYRLREQNPDADYLILERRARVGGTWICSAIPASAPTATSTRSAIRSSRGGSRVRSPRAPTSGSTSSTPRTSTASPIRSGSHSMC